MVVKMTNRLLSVVIALAVGAGFMAHATHGPRPVVRDAAPVSFKLPKVKLPAPSDIRMTAHWVSNQTLSLFDPKSEPIRTAFLRDREALEQLRHDPKAKVRGNLDDYISIQQAKLQVLEDDALDQLSRSALSVADARISEMHHVVAHAKAAITQSPKPAKPQSEEDSSD